MFSSAFRHIQQQKNMGSSTSFTEYPAESRVGRENQVYDNDIRQVSYYVSSFFFRSYIVN
jgi:hypothetical protein